MRVIIKVWRKAISVLLKILAKAYVSVQSMAFRVRIGKNPTFNGIPQFVLKKTSSLTIGDDFRLNSGSRFNVIGRNQRSVIHVGDGASVVIGSNVGMSSVAIFCTDSITFGNGIRVGGNTVFYDTDFHSLDSADRCALPERTDQVKHAPITVGNEVFIGAHSTILKGVSIGEKAIIGAGSVVSKDVPAGEIWAGNPARFIRSAI